MSATSSKRYTIVVLANGISPHTVRWLEGLNLSGRFDLHLINFNPEFKPAAEFHAVGVKEIHNLTSTQVSAAGNNYQYLWRLPETRRILKRLKPDLISTLYLTSYGFVGALLKGRTQLMHFALGSDVMVTPEQSRLKMALTRFTLKRADLLISASGTMTEKLKQTFHFPSERILTQQFGVTDAVLEFARPAETRFDFISNRQWLANSNIEYILEGLKPLTQARVALVGTEIPGLEGLGQRIRQIAAQLSNASVFGFQAYQDMIRLVSESRFLLSLTTSDGAPLSLMEAMAVGTVPILSDIAANREWVRAGHNGFLVALDNPADLQQKLQQALHLSQSDWRQMSERGKIIVRERGSLSRNMAYVARRIIKEIEASAPQS